MSLKTILFMAEAATLAHVARPWTLARSLDPLRYRVVFAVDGRFDLLFDFSGMEREPLKSISSADFMNALAKGRVLYEYDTLNEYVKSDIELIERIKPSVVVGDFRLSLSVSARLCGVPYVSISNIYWSPCVKQSYPVPDLPFTKILGVAISQQLFNLVRPVAFSLHTLPLNRIRRKYGLVSLGSDLRKVYTDADKVLYADMPDYSGDPELPPGHHFIGPILWSADTLLPEWWGQIDDTRPVVFTTLGSSGKKSLLPVIVDALGGVDVTVLMAAAGAPLPTDLPSNVKAADFLPAAEAARRSSLVISNGGSPTTHLALAAGVPCIGVCANLDQCLNMSAIERFGVGVFLRADHFEPSEFLNAIHEMLNQSVVRDRARALGVRISEKKGVEDFQDILEAMLQE